MLPQARSRWRPRPAIFTAGVCVRRRAIVRTEVNLWRQHDADAACGQKLVRDDMDLARIPVVPDHFLQKGEWSETQAGVTRVTSTEIGPSASTQMISPVMRPTARRSFSTAWRCVSAPAVA